MVSPKPGGTAPAGAANRTGTVKWYNPTKGFGFIVPDDGGGDVFIHASVVQAAGLVQLIGGQAVNFVATQGPRGMAASVVSA
ncbi:MAG: cold-shock protein [Defluviicoccus sp.]|nr:cold-shock protein [Defluviicoccus sp.]